MQTNYIGKIQSGKLTKNKTTDAGQDIHSSESVIIPPMDSRLISTELHIAIPDHHVGLLWSRSGLSVKHKLEVGAGCIDFGYTGEVKVHVYNHDTEPYKVNKGDKIAQLLTIPINLNSYNQVDSLEETDRGMNGFGSSGH